MSEPSRTRTTVSGSGVVTVRQRPSLLLMTIRLRAVEATLELGLAKLKARREAASGWLKRLGAARVDFGEPHFDDQGPQGALMKMQAVTAMALGQPVAGAATEGRDRAVNLVVTAQWDIAALSAEQTLVLVDRLRFEAAEDVGPTEPAEEQPSWTTPEEQLRQIMTQLHPPPRDIGAPQFLFIARPGDEQREKATAEAFGRARQNAEQLARAAGMRLGRLSMVHFGTPGVVDADRLMDRQRCKMLLAGSSYDLGDQESVSDSSRAVESTVTVSVSYALETAET